MGDLSSNFSRAEFACQCGCGFDTVDVELLLILQTMRDDLNATVTVTSACRCLAHNANVGGAENSQHTKGRAADVLVSGVSPTEVHRYIFNKYPDQYGLGKYQTFTHIDSRTGRARWGG